MIVVKRIIVALRIHTKQPPRSQSCALTPNFCLIQSEARPPMVTPLAPPMMGTHVSHTPTSKSS